MIEQLLDSLPILGNLSIAAALGGIIGFERERHAQAAGLRTHLIVATAACLLMQVSMYMFELAPNVSDPGRIGAQVVTGIGFLGAGVILKYGFTVRGVTTASSIWASAGIGLAVGAQYYAGALACTVVVFIALSLLDVFEKMFITGRRLRRILVTSKDHPGLLGEIETILQKQEVEIKRLGVNRDVSEGTLEVEINASFPDNVDVAKLSRELSELKGVENIGIS